MTWREELAWAAGLFDGEGHVSIRRQENRAQLVMQVGQAHPAVLERFAAAVGIGRIRFSNKAGTNHDTAYWAWSSTQEGHQAALAMLWPFLSPVKKEQARAALTARRDYLVTTKDMCRKRLHRIEGDNIVIGTRGRRRCRACRTALNKSYWQRTLAARACAR